MSRSQVRYEWCYEQTDENGDIIDSSFEDVLSNFNKELHKGENLLLVRNEGNDDEGLTDRFWGYVKNDKLPEYFSDDTGREVNIKIPSVFKFILENFLKRWKKVKI